VSYNLKKIIKGNVMKKILLLIYLALFINYGYPATYNTINSGDWSNGTIWNGGSPAPLNGNNNEILISVGNTVVLNDNITFGNGCKLYVNGDLIINGDLTSLNSLIIEVTGSLVINGNIEGKNGSTITISGFVNVIGNVMLDNNCDIHMEFGSLDIGGSLSGNGNIFGDGDINIQGENNFIDIDNNYGNIIINPSLPIKLKSFIGFRKSKNIIELNWITISELNNEYFNVEKLINNEFYPIGKIIGAGNSNIERQYIFVDYEANNSIEYYRLKQVDYNGAVEYFFIISINETINHKDGIIAYPNPMQSELNIHISCIEYILKISLIDVVGKNYVLGKDIYCDGQTFISLSTAEIPNGVYFIKFETNQETFYYDDKIIIEKR